MACVNPDCVEHEFQTDEATSNSSEYQSSCSSQSVASQMINQPSTPPAFPKRILYVNSDVAVQNPKESSKQLQLIASSTHKSANVVFDCAKDGFEALELSSKTKYHGIIIYENIPNMSGIETVRFICNHPDRSPTLKVVLIGDPIVQLTPYDHQLVTKLYSDSDSHPFLGSHFVEVLAMML
jgi:CheY-like chemotaxis protein